MLNTCPAAAAAAARFEAAKEYVCVCTMKPFLCWGSRIARIAIYFRVFHID